MKWQPQNLTSTTIGVSGKWLSPFSRIATQDLVLKTKHPVEHVSVFFQEIFAPPASLCGRPAWRHCLVESVFATIFWNYNSKHPIRAGDKMSLYIWRPWRFWRTAPCRLKSCTKTSCRGAWRRDGATGLFTVPVQPLGASSSRNHSWTWKVGRNRKRASGILIFRESIMVIYHKSQSAASASWKTFSCTNLHPGSQMISFQITGCYFQLQVALEGGVSSYQSPIWLIPHG